MNVEVLPAVILRRKALVYVRQSTQSQVLTNLESQRRQYDLSEVARQHGFANIEVIDDDLGRSASGTVARPGFDRLAALPWPSAPLYQYRQYGLDELARLTELSRADAGAALPGRVRPSPRARGRRR